MFTILSIMICGIILGFAFRKINVLQKTEKTISVTILALLFMLGLSVGSNKMIINNLGEFGSQAFILALLGLTGSLVATTLIVRLFRKGGER